ncbi:MAG: bifunctional acetate--CoA ligase family protein/GNAT family N-acetyltransferase [Desulfobacteraceae bacterium]|jgi:acetyltransferase
MSSYNLDKTFKPSSVAIIGASEKEGTIGHSLLRNVLEGGYEGQVFPINPQYKSVNGLAAYRSVLDINQPIDLAIIATPIAKSPSIIKECVKAEIGGAIIISAGGKEIGSKGKKLEQEIKKEADRGGLRIIGPNCMGIVSGEAKLNASFATLMPLPGKLAFISQSGAICSAILDLSIKEGIGFRYFVSIGSMLDVDFGDLVNYLGNDPEVSSIVLYIENLTNIRKFMSAARAVSRVKPIVVLKAGKSMAGARAASSHTGAIAGEDVVYDAAFKRAGIVRVDTIEELFDCAELMAKQPIPKGPGLAIMTNGGGPGVMAADALSTHGLEPVSLTTETMKRLDDFLPPFWSRGNPVDILGDASPERWRRALEVCFEAREINALLIIFVPQALSNAVTVAEAVAKLLYEKPHPPLFAVWMGGENVEEGMRILNNAGIPTYETPERAVSALMYMHSYAQNQEMSQEIPPKLARSLKFDQSSAKGIIERALKEENRLLTEAESKVLLKAYGIPVNRTEVANSPDEAVRLAQEMGYPVAMKLHSRDIVHKSDAQGVELNLRSEEDVESAFSRIVASAHAYDPKAELLGVTVQPMLKRPDYELILGSKRDADFGPVILFGMGGIMTEILKDQSIALPPLNRLLARRLMESTQVYKMLRGYRNRPAAKLDLLEEILIRLSQLVTDFPEIAELDINPLILVEDQACAVDARVIIKPSEVPSPEHLVISPYPGQYETTFTTRGEIEIFLRPIKPEDAPLLVELFHTLSKESIYYRFFRSMRSLPPDMLAYFTQIDYDRDMALVALDQTHPKERMLGVARIMSLPDGKTAEIAVAVGDPWQGMGIGAALMERLLSISKERGKETLCGYVLGENTQMLALARKLGFKISWDLEAHQYEIKKDLRTLSLNP